MQALGLVWGDVDSHAPDYHYQRVTLDEPQHPDAQLTLRVWRARVADGGFVVGRDIPSRELLGVLRSLGVYEPVDGGRDFRMRIAGTAFYRRFGQEVTGSLMSDLFDPQAFQNIRNEMAAVIAHNTPVSVAVERTQGGRAAARTEILVLPVTAPDHVGHWGMVGLFFEDWVS